MTGEHQVAGRESGRHTAKGHRLELNPGCCGEETEFVHVVHQMLKELQELVIFTMNTSDNDWTGRTMFCCQMQCCVILYAVFLSTYSHQFLLRKSL